MQKARRIKITYIHTDDAFFHNKSLIGVTGKFIPNTRHPHSGYFAGEFIPDSGRPGNYLYFLGLRYIRI